MTPNGDYALVARPVSEAHLAMSAQFQQGRPETVHRGGGSTPRNFQVLTVCSATPSRSAMSLDPTGSQLLGGMTGIMHCIPRVDK